MGRNQSLLFIVFPKNFTEIKIGCFTDDDSLKGISFPRSITTLGTAMNNCYSLKRVALPDSITATPYNMFSDSCSITKVIIPRNITTIAAFSFSRAMSLRVVDFTHVLAVPTLSNSNAFLNLNHIYKIVVPDSLYEDWIAASNWVTYADHIIKESEYNA